MHITIKICRWVKFIMHCSCYNFLANFINTINPLQHNILDVYSCQNCCLFQSNKHMLNQVSFINKIKYHIRRLEFSNSKPVLLWKNKVWQLHILDTSNINPFSTRRTTHMTWSCVLFYFVLIAHRYKQKFCTKWGICAHTVI